MTNLAPAISLEAAWTFALHTAPLRGLTGDHLAKGVGSSVEIQDFRHYVPGDDPRHLDWNAVARTDQLIVRLHREEIRLSVDILLDASRSMKTGEGEKFERAVQLAFLFTRIAFRMQAAPVIWVLDDRPRPIREAFELHCGNLEADGRLSLAEGISTSPPALRNGSLRLLVSDFLYPHDPRALTAFASRNAGGLALIQTLHPDEIDPGESGYARLRDAELDEEIMMRVDASTVARYRERLGNLQEGLARSVRAVGGRFAVLSSSEDLETCCREGLRIQGVLAPA